MYRSIILLTGLLLNGCAYKQGLADVSYGELEPIPMVRLPKDRDRWYIVAETETWGQRVFFLDTGYGRTTCDDDWVKELGLETRGKKTIHGESGKTAATKTILPPFSFGGHTIERLVCTVRDLNTTSSIEDQAGIPIAGVIGMDVLRRFRTVIKPQEAQLLLSNPANHEKITDGIKLKREWGLGIRPTIRAQINNKTRWMILDTGASITLANGKCLNLPESSKLSSGAIKGSGKKKKRSKKLDRYRIQELGIAGIPKGEGILYDRRRGPFYMGLLGLNILGDYAHEYDWKHGRARFTPIEKSALPIFRPGSLPRQ